MTDNLVGSRDGILDLRELITLKNYLGRDLLGGILGHDLVETRVFREHILLCPEISGQTKSHFI
jgi:hypothetical protein